MQLLMLHLAYRLLGFIKSIRPPILIHHLWLKKFGQSYHIYSTFSICSFGRINVFHLRYCSSFIFIVLSANSFTGLPAPRNCTTVLLLCFGSAGGILHHKGILVGVSVSFSYEGLSWINM